MDDWENNGFGQYVPLCMAYHRCGADNHIHVQLGVTSDQPPMPGGHDINPWHNEETGEFFYPFDSYTICWN